MHFLNDNFITITIIITIIIIIIIIIINNNKQCNNPTHTYNQTHTKAYSPSGL
jgi:ascorbate-specific PTS system EIIC-type component UlaA